MMFTLSRTELLKLGAAGAMVALALISTHAYSGELAANLGPVGPYEPILTGIGNKQVVAHYAPADGRCSVNAVVWEDVEAKTAARIRVTLRPGEIAQIDAATNESLNLQCGFDAQSLATVDTVNMVAEPAQ
jgi:hypothetical protein